MSKHKIIHKFFDSRRPREEKEILSDSSEEESLQLLEVDCNHFFYNQNSDQSLTDFMESLKQNQHQPMSLQEELYKQENQQYSDEIQFTLEQINQRYIAMMAQALKQQSSERKAGNFRVRFDGRVRAKYFNKQEAVVQVFDAEQYTSFEQYQQSYDVIDQPLQN